MSDDYVQLTIDQLKEQYENITELRPKIEEVKRAAENFVKSYRLYEKQVNQDFKGKSAKTIRHHLDNVLFEQGVRKKFDIFQNLINLYFNQSVKVAYVYFDPNQNNQAVIALIDNDMTGLELGGPYNKVQYDLKEIQIILKDDTYNSTLLDAAQKSIYARWQIAKKHVGRGTYLPILWLINRQWGGAMVNNLGTIAEAYVNFYVNKYEFYGSLEENVQTYILDQNYGAASVDNASGFLIGDVQVGNVALAVKKQGASAMNMKRVLEFTEDILNQGFSETTINLFKEKWIQDEKNKAIKAQVKNGIDNRIEDTAKHAIEEDLIKMGIIKK